MRTLHTHPQHIGECYTGRAVEILNWQVKILRFNVVIAGSIFTNVLRNGSGLLFIYTTQHTIGFFWFLSLCAVFLGENDFLLLFLLFNEFLCQQKIS